MQRSSSWINRLSTFWKTLSKPNTFKWWVAFKVVKIFFFHCKITSTLPFNPIQSGWSVCLQTDQKTDGTKASQLEYVIDISGVHPNEMSRPHMSHNSNMLHVSAVRIADILWQALCYRFLVIYFMNICLFHLYAPLSVFLFKIYSIYIR